MTEEERKMYENTGTYKKPSMADLNNLTKRKDEDMKINKDRLMEICATNGFTKKAYTLAAEEFGVTPNSIASYISTNKLSKSAKQEPQVKEVISKKVSTKEAILIIDSELEVLDKIKTIVEENRFLKGRMSQLKASLEEILKSIS